MTTFLFWNIARKPLHNVIAALAIEYDVDVLMLAECTLTPGMLLPTLNRHTTRYDYAPNIGCTKIELYTRFSEQFIRPVYDEDRLTIRHLALPGATDILLAITHAISKTHYEEIDQTAKAADLAESIRIAERDAKHSRTVLVGDLNMNPFEDGVVTARGLHGVMSQQIARKGHRTVQGKNYPFFYNPMWNLLGDVSPSQPGTYYYSGSTQRELFWNMFDQVLVRPDLLDRFDSNALRIVDQVGTQSLLSRGIPDKRTASDHLPLLFTLNL